MEDKDIYYVSNLSEKIYHVYDYNDNMQKELDAFFKELVARRRYDSEEDGIQACMVIFPDKFAAKIAENDGLSSHFVTSINLVEFLNKKNKYLSNSGAGYFQLSIEERRILYEAIQLRIIDNPDELMIAITSSVDIKSTFQLKVLKNIVLQCKFLMDNNVYKNVAIGLNTPSIHIDFEDWNVGRENLFLDDIEETERKL